MKKGDDFDDAQMKTLISVTNRCRIIAQTFEGRTNAIAIGGTE